MKQALKHADVWIILVLFIMLASLALFSQHYINKSAAQVAENFPGIAIAIEQEDWRQARALFAISRERWQQVVKTWPMLINHNDMRDVEISFVDMEVLLQQEDGPRAALEIASLRYYLQHVPRNERFSLQNIL